MGLTPLHGLPGATRSGSIDPSLIFHYTNKAGRKESYANYKPLETPEWEGLCYEKGSQESCMKAVGRFLREVIKEYISSYFTKNIY